jgi:hypothetical protein
MGEKIGDNAEHLIRSLSKVVWCSFSVTEKFGAERWSARGGMPIIRRFASTASALCGPGSPDGDSGRRPHSARLLTLLAVLIYGYGRGRWFQAPPVL